mgnify:CR=1 FL=1
MKHNRMRRLLAGVTAAALLAAPALAAEDTAPAPQMPDAWAVGELADSYAMGLVDDNYTTYIQSTITSEQLSAMTGIVADKLALLELPQRAADTEGLVVDTTRGGVMNALYQEAAAYDIDGVEEGAAAFLTGLGVVRGDQAGGLNEDRPCTYQEAMVMAERLILALYDANDAGSRGLLWKAVNGDNTLYLLGTIHMDRSNVYPLHKSVRDALDASQVVSFELDLNDQEGMALLAQLQAYSDGTTLVDHISPELYARVQAAAVSLGMEPNGFDAYKPWALASTFGVLSLQDDTTGANAMAIDVYINGERGQDHRLRGDLRLPGRHLRRPVRRVPGGLSGRQPGRVRGDAQRRGGRRGGPGAGPGPAGADCRHVRCLEEPGPRCPGGGLRQGGYP